MKSQNLIILISLFFGIQFSGWGQSTFIKHYWSTDFHSSSGYGNALDYVDESQIIHSYSNGDVFVGYVTKDYGCTSTCEHGMTFSRIDSDGQIVWTKNYINPDGLGAYHLLIPLAVVEDNGYSYVTGYKAWNQSEIFILKIDGSNGNLIWNFSLPGIYGVPRDLISTSDNSLVIAGMEDGGQGAFQRNNFLIKIDQATGSVLWAETYGGTDIFLGQTICENNNNEYVLFYDTFNFLTGILKVNATNGSLISGSEKELDFTGSGGIIVPGDVYFDPVSNNYTLFAQHGNNTPTLIRFNSALNVTWCKIANLSITNPNNSPFGGQIRPMQDGFLISFVASNGSSPSDQSHLYLKANLAGDFVWCKQITDVSNSSFDWEGQAWFTITNDGIYSPSITPGVSISGGSPLTLIKTNLVGDLLSPSCNTDVINVTTSSTNTTQNLYQIFTAPLTYAVESPFSFTDPDFQVQTLCESQCADPFTAEIDAGGPTTICSNEFPVTLNAQIIGTNPGPFSYQWSDGSTNSNLTATGPGFYSVVITSVDGCQSTATITLSVTYPLFMNPITSSGTCNSTMLYADPNPGFSNYCWYEQSNPSVCIGTGSGFYATSPGTYCVSAEASTGCISTRCITVNSGPTVTALQPNMSLCVGDPAVQLSNLMFTGFPFPIFEQSTNFFTPAVGGVFSSNANCGFVLTPGFFGGYTFTPQSCNVGMNEIYYTYTDANGCLDIDTMFIEVTEPPIATINPINDISLCTPVAPFIPTVSCTGTNITSSWSISPAVGGAFNYTTGEFNPTLAGTGTYTITYTCQNSCGSSSSSSTFNVTNGPDVTALQPIINLCVGDPAVQLSATTFIGFPPPIFGQTTSYFTPSMGGVLTSNATCGFALSPGFFGGYTFTPMSCNVGSNIVYYTVTDGNGCSSIDSIEIIVSDPAIVTIDPIQDINLCSGNSSFIPIVNCSDPSAIGSWSISPTTVGFNTSNGEFNPNLAGVGTYTITYSCQNACGISSSSSTFQVIDLDYWHQTTKNTFAQEIINDVITDTDENVYVVGTFTTQTTLNGGGNTDIVLISNSLPVIGPEETFTFVAKYDPCGSLIWAANSVINPNNVGNSITLNETDNVVFITGNLSGAITFMNAQTNIGSSCINSANITGGTGGEEGYIAQFDMTTGCINYVNEVIPDNFVDCRSITVNENTGDIYVGGSRGTVVTNPYAVFIHKYTPGIGFGNNIGGVVWDILGNLGPWDESMVNDMDFDEVNNQLWTIGMFKKDLTLTPGTVNILSVASKDGFIVAYTDNGTTPNQNTGSFRPGNTPQGGWMIGEGVAIDYLGNPYFTGTYTGITNPDPFRLQSQGSWSTDVLPGISGTNKRSFFIGSDLAGHNVWVRHGENVNGEVFGTSVTTYKDKVFFSGDFKRNDLNIYGYANPSLFMTVPFNTSPVPNRHVYVAGFTNFGDVLWGNATVGPNGLDDEHHSTAITADEIGNGYVVGSYRGTIDYLSGIPNSSVLVSTPLLSINAYVMRVDLGNGDLRTPASFDQITDTELILDQEPTERISAYPNPTSGSTTIEVQLNEEESYQLEVYNSMGELVFSTNTTNKVFELNMENYPRGIYLVQVQLESGIETVKIIKS